MRNPALLDPTRAPAPPPWTTECADRGGANCRAGAVFVSLVPARQIDRPLRAQIPLGAKSLRFVSLHWLK